MNRHFAWLLVCAIVVAPVWAQAPADRLAGDVVALDGSTLRLRLNTGQALVVTLPADARISARARKAGRHRARRLCRCDGDPASRRNAARIRGARLSRVDAAARGGSTMTNASVAAVAGSGSARTMTLKYPGGEQVITVPAGIPIVMFEAADRKEIVPGAHIIVSVTHGPDESLVANRVTVGLRGLVPPV